MTFEDLYEPAVERLMPHKEHQITITCYAQQNIAIECEDCKEVLIDFTKEGTNG